MGDVTFDSDPSSSDRRSTRHRRTANTLNFFLPSFPCAISDRLVRLWQYSNQACSVRVSAPSGLGFSSQCTVCWGKVNPPSPELPNTRHCHCQLSALLLCFRFRSFLCSFSLPPSSPCPLLFSLNCCPLDDPRVAYCFHYVACASVAWHSCSHRSPQPRKNSNKSIWALDTSGKLTN